MRGDLGSVFRIDGGDGDQGYLGHLMMARRVSESWFPHEIWSQPAYLLRVEGGRHDGLYVAITSRWTISLEAQLENQDWISVVVHVIDVSGPDFRTTEKPSRAIGMAAIQALD